MIFNSLTIQISCINISFFTNNEDIVSTWHYNQAVKEHLFVTGTHMWYYIDNPCVNYLDMQSNKSDFP